MNSIIELTDYYSSNNYAPLKLVISKGKGVKVWDLIGKQYIDCISGFSVANQGHCHPTIVKAMTNKLQSCLSFHVSFIVTISGNGREKNLSSC